MTRKARQETEAREAEATGADHGATTEAMTETFTETPEDHTAMSDTNSGETFETFDVSDTPTTLAIVSGAEIVNQLTLETLDGLSYVTQETVNAAYMAPPASGESQFEVAGHKITVPVFFVPGMVFDENTARHVQVYLERSFASNATTNAKNKADRLAKAKTQKEIDENQPLSAVDYVAAFIKYVADGGPSTQNRTDREELIRMEAAWRVFTAAVKAHNDNLALGGNGSADFPKRANTIIVLPSSHIKEGKKIVKSIKDQQDDYKRLVLSRAEFADRVADEIANLKTELGAKPEATSVSVTAVDDLM